MKVTTYSGTVYDIKDITEIERETGNYFEAKAARISDHPITYVGRFRIKEELLATPEFHEIIFKNMPEVGSGWHYAHEVWGNSTTSQVQKIEE